VKLDSSNGLVKVERKRSSDLNFIVLVGKTIKSGGGRILSEIRNILNMWKWKKWICI